MKYFLPILLAIVIAPALSLAGDRWSGGGGGGGRSGGGGGSARASGGASRDAGSYNQGSRGYSTQGSRSYDRGSGGYHNGGSYNRGYNYDRGARYYDRGCYGNSGSSFGFTFGFGNYGYGDYSYGAFGYGYNAGRYYGYGDCYRPAPVVVREAYVYPAVVPYCPPPVYCAPAPRIYYYEPCASSTYYSGSVYYYKR